jgi:hypothetical protein
MGICKIKNCDNTATARDRNVTNQQKHYFMHNGTFNTTYFICDDCEKKHWQYNSIRGEYYQSIPRVSKVKIDLGKIIENINKIKKGGKSENE